MLTAAWCKVNPTEVTGYINYIFYVGVFLCNFNKIWISLRFISQRWLDKAHTQWKYIITQNPLLSSHGLCPQLLKYKKDKSVRKCI